MYTLFIAAQDGGTPPLSTTTTVAITVTKDASKISPVWQQVYEVAIDDLGSTVKVFENATIGTYFMPSSITLYASPNSVTDLPVRYHVTTDGKKRLDLNGDLNIPAQNTSPVMSLAVFKTLDASLVWQYTLRCRAFVSCYICLMQDYNKSYVCYTRPSR